MNVALRHIATIINRHILSNRDHVLRNTVFIPVNPRFFQITMEGTILMIIAFKDPAPKAIAISNT